MKVYTVVGKFTIPGTKENTTFATKVTALSIRDGSRKLVKILQKQFAFRIPKEFVFADDFAMMNLDWEANKTQEEIDSQMIHSI